MDRKIHRISRSFRRYIARLFCDPYPLNKSEDVSPLFIIGSGRSGNTLLRRILMGSPELYIPPETYVLGASIEFFEKNSHSEWPIICRKIVSMLSNGEDFHTFPTQEMGPLLDLLFECPEERRSYSFIINEFYMYMSGIAKPSANRWGDKTPINAFHLDKLDRAFPGSRYLHIMRDGVDVIASYLEMGRYTDIESASRRWLAATRKCREFGERRPDLYFELKYEDLVSRPREVSRTVFDFAGLEYSDSMIAQAPRSDQFGDIDKRAHYQKVDKPISSSSIGRGRKALDKDEFARVTALIGDQLQELGYPINR